MYIQAIPNRGSPPAILLRESYREGGKVRKRTLLNLTHWPPDLLEGFKALLKGGTVVPVPASPEVFTIRRALPHGHVAAVLGSLRQIGLDRILGPDGNRCRDLVIAMVAARLTDPVSQLPPPQPPTPDAPPRQGALARARLIEPRRGPGAGRGRRGRALQGARLARRAPGGGRGGARGKPPPRPHRPAPR